MCATLTDLFIAILQVPLSIGSQQIFSESMLKKKKAKYILLLNSWIEG